MPPTPPDLVDRKGIETLVDSFYETVRTDEVLGFIFDDVAQVNWSQHLPKMNSFWETVLFRSGGYKGDIVTAHSKFVSQTEMGRPQFDRWLMHFKETVDAHFKGENAGHIKRCAEDMANVIHGKINGIKDARYDPANLTPQQKARYAEYRKKKEREI